MIKKSIFKKSKYLIFTLLVVCTTPRAYASIINGTIDSSSHTAQVCEDTSCTVSGTSPVNFGYFTSTPASNVIVTDTSLSGYIWGSSFGFAVLNCSNTVSGCSNVNGNFKVSNDHNGHLSGYAWGDSAGWINFGPFSNSSTTPVTISNLGEFNGYAWAQNFGWIKFDCSNSSYCVKTDWRPQNSRPQCSDGVDNDSDLLIDSADPGCHTDGNYSNPSSYDPTDNQEFTSHGGGGGGGSGGGGSGGSGGGGGGSGGGFTPFCILYPSDPTCNNIPSFCALHPNNINCIVISPIKKVLDTPAGKVVSKTITTIGALGGIAAAFSVAIFASPLTFSELFLIPLRLWSLLMAALGIKKRNRPWGIVYDSVTKQPIDPAYVILEDLNGQEVATSITDLDGRYGFLVPAGQYKLIARKTNYIFPSVNLAGKTSDELYADLYFSGVIDVAEGEVITKNIPMDPLKFDWNEFAKNKQGLMKFYSRRDIIINRISNILFILGFIVTIIATLSSPQKYNIAMFAVYCVLFILKNTILKPKSFGKIKNKESGDPLSFAILRIFNSNNFEVSKKVADKTGKYYSLLPNGTYSVKIENKNPDGTYSLAHSSEPIEVKKGYIDNTFEI